MKSNQQTTKSVADFSIYLTVGDKLGPSQERITRQQNRLKC